MEQMLQSSATAGAKRSVEKFLEPLLRLEALQAGFLGPIDTGTQSSWLPRFTFHGPNSSDPLRIGIFAAIHGDEPAGAQAAVQLLAELATRPVLAENFQLQVYPVCNPTGFEDNTRHSRTG